MSLIVIGLSHHSAPIAVLEGLAELPELAHTVATSVLASSTVTEAVVLSTCNRLEVYAEAREFHPAVAAIGEALAIAAGGGAPSPFGDARVDPAAMLAARVNSLAEHLYVRYDDSAVAHTFTVASGLDSMAIGEAQILGQMRDALGAAQTAGQAGTSLNSLFQHALRVGKRAHSETEIDRHSVSLVQMGLEQATGVLGDLGEVRACVIGAGAMSGLAAATVSRVGVRHLDIVNRTPERAQRLAASTGGTARLWEELAEVVAQSDLVITCTGSLGHVLDGADLLAASVRRSSRAQVVIDLALPRDVAPPETWTRPVPSATVIGLQELGDLLEGRADTHHVGAVRDLVTGEVAAFLTKRMEQAVAPTVAALRSRAADVVAGELDRLDQRLPDLDQAARAEVGLAVHRIVEKLLHTPTKRIKEFAMDQGGPDYAAVLRELFDLEPKEIANVSTPPQRGGA